MIDRLKTEPLSAVQHSMILSKLFEASKKIADGELDPRILQKSYNTWSERIESGEVIDSEVNYRENDMPLPTPLPANMQFPKQFGAKDYTQLEIDAIRSKGTYDSMQELDKYKFLVVERLQDEINDIFDMSFNEGGAMIEAPGGYGKTFIFKYYGAMAGQHSLNHKNLWLTDPFAVVNNTETYKANVREKHFVYMNAKDLAQTKIFKGSGKEAWDPLKRILGDAKMQGVYVWILDEIASAFKPEAGGQITEAAATFDEELKNIVQPESGEALLNVVGLLADENAEAFYNQQGGGQFLRRFDPVPLQPYTFNEGVRMLVHGWSDWTKKKRVPQFKSQESAKETLDVINKIVKDAFMMKTEGDVSVGLPAKINKILNLSIKTISQRKRDYAKYKNVAGQIEQLEGFVDAWKDTLIKVNAELKVLEANEGQGGERPQGTGGSQKKLDELKERGISTEYVGFEGFEGGEDPATEVGQISPRDSDRGKSILQKKQIQKEAIQKINHFSDVISDIKLSVSEVVQGLEDTTGENFRDDLADLGNIKMYDLLEIPEGSKIIGKKDLENDRKTSKNYEDKPLDETSMLESLSE